MQRANVTGGGSRRAARVAVFLCATAVLLLARGTPAHAGEYWFAGHPFGTDGSYGVVVTPSGDYLVANRGTSQVRRHAGDDSLLNSWGSFGTGDGQFQDLWGIATDSTGAVYVTDTGNHRIQKFTASGTFVTKWGSLGTGNGQFNRPVHVDVDAAGFVYVTDSNNNRVQKFDSAGNFVTKWGSAGTGDGQFSTPHGLAVGPGGVVYVGDSGGRRIEKFDSNGNFLAKWGIAGTSPGQFAGDIWGLDTDAGGDVYATMNILSGGCTMNKFTSSGTLLDSICNRPSSRGLDVADEADDDLLITQEGSADGGLTRYARGARLTIRMTSVDSGTVTFAVGGGATPPVTNLGEGWGLERVYLPPAGTYSVSATSDTLLQTGASCTDGSDPANVSLTAGEDVICTYAFERKPQVIVRQDSQPPSTQAFSFSAGGGLSPASFVLDGCCGEPPPTQITLTAPGSGSGYSVTQTTPAGWYAATTACSDGSAVGNISLSAREIVTCTFTNGQVGSGRVVVSLDSQPDSATLFRFHGPQQLFHEFELNDDGSGTPSTPNELGTYVTPGTRAIREDFVPGWALTSAGCSDGSPVWAIDVSADETVTCSFTNQQAPTGTVIAEVIQLGDPFEYSQAFAFTAGGGLSTPQYPASFNLFGVTAQDEEAENSRTFQVPVGSGYSLAANGVPPGWTLASANCDDGSPTANITVSSGETITCTFVMEDPTTLTIVQDTHPDGPQDFTYQATGAGMPPSFGLDDDGDEGNTFPSKRTFQLQPGTFSLAQQADPSWNRFFGYCEDGSPLTNITLSRSEDLYCHFGNTPLGEPQPATSTGAGGAAANGGSQSPMISGNGNFVAFHSTATNLSAADPTTSRDVYLRNVRTGEVRLVSRATGVNGAVGNSDSMEPSVSADARYVAFSSSATNLDPADTSFLSDVYVRDVASGITTLVSRASGAGGAKGNANSLTPAISPNGRYVTFSSQSTNLDPADTDSTQDVFVRDLQTGTTTLVSRATGASGAKSNGDSVYPSVSDDGRVAFFSAATNLDPGDSDTRHDVFVRDTVAGTTTLASRASGVSGAKGNSDSYYELDMSGNGRYVAFYSFAGNLTPEGRSGVFVRDLQSATTELVSRADGVAGAPATDTTSLGGITYDGRYVSFGSYSMWLDPAIRPIDDPVGSADAAYVRDRQAGTTRLRSAQTGREGSALYSIGELYSVTTSDDGRYTVFCCTQIRDAQTSVTSQESRASPTYPRAKAATPFFAPLVPAYQACASPNRQHAPPLSFGSCAPPSQSSSRLTAGTPDANGAPSNLIGSVKLRSVTEPLPLNPNNGDQSDVAIDVSVTDVRNSGSLTDYTGELEARLSLQVTDRVNFPATGGMGPGTTQGFAISATVPCTATGAATVGSTCTLSTSTDALVPGTVIENSRGLWELGQLAVYDGGADSDGDTTGDNSPFLRQGVFVP